MNNTPQTKQGRASTSTRSAESLFAELVQCERHGDFKAARAITTELRTSHGWSCVKCSGGRKGVDQ